MADSVHAACELALLCKEQYWSLKIAVWHCQLTKELKKIDISWLYIFLGYM